MILFRAGRYRVIGEKLTQSGDILELRPLYVLQADGEVGRVSGDHVSINQRFVVNEDWEVEESVLQETGELVPIPYDALIHESVLPLVVEMRQVDLPSSSLVAYERRGQGLGFLVENEVKWTAMRGALTQVELGERLALEGLKPVLAGLGLFDRTKPQSVLEQTRVIERDLHVYMKNGPFRDISQIHEGTDVAVVGYQNGCAIVEADGEPFWIPLEEAELLPVKKDDHFYFTQDSDRNEVPDPLDFLPSKVGIGAVTGSAKVDDNYNAQAEMHRVAGVYYGYDVQWLQNDEFGVLDPEVPAAIDNALDSISKGQSPDEIACQMVPKR
jgi:hypothetical protein